uniref:Uncharacterized protein n=1 Tax=Amphimedon queenslandica TaxID=400682 RepID=A0A1X7TAN0_AMPQE
MAIELIFLGTGSAYPSPIYGFTHTPPPTILISFPFNSEVGGCWLFDCGEGSQTQLMRSTVRPGRITKIFITHLHGDHRTAQVAFYIILLGLGQGPQRWLQKEARTENKMEDRIQL